MLGVPELPEVETIRGQLAPILCGRAIIDAGCHPSAKFASAPEAVGAEIKTVRRRGKYLILGLDGDDGEHEMIVHLGMTGRLTTGTEIDMSHPHLRAWWRLDDDTVLAFHDIRRFGRIHVVASGCYDTIATLSRIGPEPFDDSFDGEWLWRSLRASRRCIKTQLLSQRPVAGVGNIYADEALWLARVNPAMRRLSRPRCDELADAIRTALSSGLRHGGTTLRDYVAVNGATGGNQHHLRCYGRAGEPCERCGGELRRKVIDARGTTWCPVCQAR